MVVVRCYDLVPLRTQTKWTREMDDHLRANYVPGLDVALVTVELRARFKVRWFRCGTEAANRMVANRLSELGLRNRMKV